MSIPLNRKLIAISTEAYAYLMKLRQAEAKRLGFRLVTITDYASTLILATPIPNNGHKRPEGVKEETHD